MLQISLVKTVPRSRHRPTYVQLRGCATVCEHSPERQAAPGHSLQTHLNHLRFTSVLHKSSILATCYNAPLAISDAAVGQPGRQLCSSGSLKRVPPGTYENYSFPSSSARSTSVISEWPDGCVLQVEVCCVPQCHPRFPALAASTFLPRRLQC